MSNKNKKVASGGGSRSLLMTFMFLTAVAACGISGYLFWEMKFASPAVVATEGEVKTAPAPVQVEPLYASMNTFTVSLKPTANESDRVLYLGLSIRVAEPQSLTVLEKYLPEYRSRIFMLLTHQTYEGLATDEGKRRLINAIQGELDKPLAFNQSIRVTDVLINEFILR
ncbi:flagellar basal body-associated FliL family protein [Enterobacter cloacae]|uniref:flagellar basal body-associated FliL family protein n=1 Tax=Enterobacter cloacae complex TaxID=354276 RepID=UPI00210DE613|nr:MULTISPECIES: flagellar basal body-associated FliL family protein [Enterobacter cloacae complex]MCQ4444170.1 flagellar basal body-associated FliL family protein [Enterobacter cloacae]MDW2866371.1 flagellar basal body-associated FliL family protein [Enterobacter hormaechei]